MRSDISMRVIVFSAATAVAGACANVPLTDDAVAAKLNAMRKGRTRRPARSAQPAPVLAAAAPIVLPGTEVEDVPVWDVPPRLRLPGAPACTSHGYHASLDDVFPGVGLGEAWEGNSELRTALRYALRQDLFLPTVPAAWSEKQYAAATGLDAACMVTWRRAAFAGEACAAFTAAFQAHGLVLNGRDFVLGLGALCGSRPHGSLIDIVPLQRRVQHSWHQDAGISSLTVLLGFPRRNEYEGGGVFSSHVKLSHPLRPTQGETHGAVVEYERFDPPPEPIPDEYVLRPLYGRGREIWVSDDSSHLHSTPDQQYRECLWRFM